MSPYGQHLRSARRQAGYRSASAYARHMGVNESTYLKYEAGSSEFSLDFLCAVARDLRLTAGQVLGLEPLPASSVGNDVDRDAVAAASAELRDACSAVDEIFGGGGLS